MDELVVDFASLQALASGIDKRTKVVGDLLDNLQRQIEALTERWDGAASEGFRHIQADWLAAAEDLRTRLAGIRDLVVTAHDNHAGAVRTNTGMWRV